MKEVVVLGGGTAGYLSAFAIKMGFPETKVSVVASKVIGTVGPGEGLTPLIHELLDNSGISTQEFLDETGGTIKLGINFVGWNKDKDSKYLETFYNPVDALGEDIYEKVFLESLYSDVGLESINVQAFGARKGLVSLEDKNAFAFHVDATKMVTFFEKKAAEVGIDIIDKIVTRVTSKNNGDISSLVFEDLSEISADLFIDCSGFRRELIGKHFNTKWIDVGQYLPTDSAIACTIPSTDEESPYTNAIAMKYGWAWKIPLQHRSGCGYVYDSKRITAEEAEQELRDLVGNDLVVMGKFKMDAGFYDDIYVNNVLAIGLSSSFFEPLEASSIDRALGLLFTFIELSKKHDINETRNRLNDYARIGHHELFDYIHMHYITNKTDNDFWNNIQKKKNVPGHVEHKMLSMESIEDFMDNFNEIKNIGFNNTWKFQNWATILCENMVDRNSKGIDIKETKEYNGVTQEVINGIGSYVPHSHYLKNNKEKS